MMKQYYKELEGKKVFFSGVLVKDGKQVINPSEELILDAGWIGYIPPEPSLEEMKANKIMELESYDKSNSVNVFHYNSIPMWLSREERVVIKDRFEREKAKGVELTKLYYEGRYIEVSPEIGIQLIDMVSSYADECFDATELHRSKINSLETKEEVESYDYTLSYPEKLNL